MYFSPTHTEMGFFFFRFLYNSRRLSTTLPLIAFNEINNQQSIAYTLEEIASGVYWLRLTIVKDLSWIGNFAFDETLCLQITKTESIKNSHDLTHSFSKVLPCKTLYLQEFQFFIFTAEHNKRNVPDMKL